MRARVMMMYILSDVLMYAEIFKFIVLDIEMSALGCNN